MQNNVKSKTVGLEKVTNKEIQESKLIAACEYVQATTKKVKNENAIYPIITEETPNSEKRIQSQQNSSKLENLIGDAFGKDLSSFTFNNSLENNQEEEQETLNEFMRDQNEIQSHMVAILFDWLVEVAHSFHFKRETFYLSRNYIERYLLRQPNVLIAKFQLLGVAAIFIAHKCEEIYPKTLKDFHRLIQDQYTIQEIEEMENESKYSHFWLNYYTKLWDEYIVDKELNVSLKERSNESYYRYRELVQLFDVCLIDYRFKKDEKITALSLIYLVIAKSMQIFEDYGKMASQQAEIKCFFDSNHEYNQIFRQFIDQSDLYLHFDRKIEFKDLRDVVCETTKYFILRFDNALPRVLLNNQDFIDELQHEELLSFQTYNRNTIETINYLLKQKQ